MRGDHVEQMRAEGYTLLRELGKGGFATVYEAEHVRLRRRVAIKLLTVDLSEPGAARRFERECESVGRLSSHPNVVDVLDARITAGGHAYIAMRLYEGGTLSNQLAAQGPLDPSAAIHLGIRMAEALDAGHAAGIIHRDVKPANVLLDEHGESYLSDFGIAVLLDPDVEATTTAAFSQPHAAPEVLIDNEFGVASDVYALASTLQQALTGMPPFVANTEARQVMMILHEPPPPIGRTDLPHGLQDVISRGLEKQPARRWPSMTEFARALGGLEDRTVLRRGPRAQPFVAPPAPPSPAGQGAAWDDSDTRERPLAAASVTQPPGAPSVAQLSTPPGARKPTKRRRHLLWLVPAAFVAVGAGVAGALALQSPGEAEADAVAVPSAPAPTEQPAETAEATPTPTPTAESGDRRDPDSISLSGRYVVGDCLLRDYSLVDCSQPHVLQVTAFRSRDRDCITAGEAFVGRGATFTTRVVHDQVRGVEVAPSLEGSMCVAALAVPGDVQQFQESLERSVSDTLASARLVGGCQSASTSASLGDARDLRPCDPANPWLSGHFWSPDALPPDSPVCRDFVGRLGGGPSRAEPIPTPFDTAALRKRESGRGAALNADQNPSFFVPRVEVRLAGAQAETFEAAVPQALPMPETKDHAVHYRMVCGAKVY